jgi:DNA-binding transcriptional LysR family regulator
MEDAMDRFRSLRTFVAVADEGSFTAAAKRLGMSVKLASKDVQDLEAHLRAQLFNRTTRSVALTDVGRAYLQRCRPVLDQIDDLDSVVLERQRRVAGLIRITAPTSFGGTVLADAIGGFVRDHREVEVDLVLTDARVALVEQGFDVAVRIGELRDSSLVVKRLSPMPLTLCAAPAYLDGRGRPRDPEALATHACLIDENQSNARIWSFSRGERTVDVGVGGGIRCNAPGAIARLAAAGAGIARAPLYTVEDALAGGRLERVLPDWRSPDFGLFALYPPNRHLTMRVRAFLDHLEAAFRGRWSAGTAAAGPRP